MFVGNRFYFISLPRCASTSFMLSCIRQGIELKHVEKEVDEQIKKVDLSLSNEELADSLMHTHENIQHLQQRYGFGHDIISVKRDKYDQFISLWKHVIDETERTGNIVLAEKFKNLDESALLNWTLEDVLTKEKRQVAAKEFIDSIGDPAQSPYVHNIIEILITPMVTYHSNNPKIIWFDIKKLTELEDWVSNKLGISFKLEKMNSSQHFEAKLKNTALFREKYDKVYGKLFNVKNSKTLL